jgi:hypothetical protein
LGIASSPVTSRDFRFPPPPRRFGCIPCVAFPQYKIPVERLKEEWANRIARQRMRKRRPPSQPSRITDNSEPWIKNPSSVAEFWEIACWVNETVAKWAPPQDNSSRP